MKGPGRFYLLGRPVAGSLSPVMHNAAFRALGLDARYDAVDVGPEDFVRVARELVARPHFAGANVTIPHKRVALDLCASLSARAVAAKAVNTLVPEVSTAGGRPRLAGHNTDVTAVLSLLDRPEVARGGTVVLIGAGGAAAAVVAALSEMGVGRLVVVNRSQPAAAALAAMSRGLGLPTETAGLDRHTLALCLADRRLTAIVNATPLKDAGEWMAVGLDEALSLAGDLARRPEGAPVVLDLAYRTGPTFLNEAAARAGCRTIDGRDFLIAQGAAAFELWTGMKAPLEVMRAAVYGSAGDGGHDLPR